MQEPPPNLDLWGKTDRSDPERYHPLLYHLIDVGGVAGALWDQALPAATRARLSRALGLDEGSSRSVVVLLAALHDLGKACPHFQARYERARSVLPPQGLSFPSPAGDWPHGAVSALEVGRLLECGVLASWPRDASQLLATIVGGHHGLFPEDRGANSSQLGGSAWSSAREAMATALARALDLTLPDQLPTLTEPAIVPLLSGFISVADWIGSMEEHFPAASQTDVGSYVAQSPQRVSQALTASGWLPRPASLDKERAFRELFTFEPNAMQEAAVKAIDAASEPYLLIVEEAMGGGKTEAALYAVDRGRARRDAGFYIALPTQATGNAMHARVTANYLRDAPAMLVHGNAFLHTRLAAEPGQAVEDATDIAAWFTARKRPLLAPYGVGTVDQSLMAVLQTKHWFVRLFGLAGKTVVFDEVHAYDIYMTGLFRRLLEWLSVLDCSVVVLSATLPSERRRELVEAFTGRTDGDPAPYPRLTMATRTHVNATPLPQVTRPTVSLRREASDLARLPDIVRGALPQGGHGAVLCNTVARAQVAYRALSSALEPEGWTITLFHARMPAGMRRRVEAQTLDTFGRDRPSTGRSIVVATQVIEQSLDLDFDWMATDFAPVDLLLQRAGRVWRHLDKRPPAERPVASPVLTLLCDDGDGNPGFGDSRWVYDEYVLLRSWLALCGRDSVRIPADIEHLVEEAYSPEPADEGGLADRLAAARAEFEARRTQDEAAASRVLVTYPRRPTTILRRFNAGLADDENPSVHESVRAATRLGRPSIAVLCLMEQDGVLTPCGADSPVSVGAEPGRDDVRALMDAAVAVSKPAIYRALRDPTDENLPRPWRRCAPLRYTRAVRFVGGKASVDGRTLRLSESMGLEIDPSPDVRTEGDDV